METKNVAQIIEEVRQLCSQYQEEVPSRRRTWPRSIKERIFQLSELELSRNQISIQTGIPVSTLYSWMLHENRAQAFLPLKVIENEEPKLLVKSDKPLARPDKVAAKKKSRGPYQKSLPTLIIVAPNGVRFEGLDLSSALKIASQLGVGLKS